MFPEVQTILNTKCFFIIVALIASGYPVFCQDTYELGLLPAINLNKRWQSSWNLNVKIESRQLLKEGLFSEAVPVSYTYELTDVATVLSKKIGFQNNLAGGYLFRLRGDDWFHRTLQQYSITSRGEGLRMGHRVAADQTFSLNESPEFRFRYRITLEKSLNGQSIDAKEFYVKLNHEYLWRITQSNSSFETRIVPLLGYEVDHANKVEFGLDYRIAPLFESSLNHRFFVSLSWFASL